MVLWVGVMLLVFCVIYLYIDEQFHCKQSNGPIYIHTATLTLYVKVTHLSFYRLGRKKGLLMSLALHIVPNIAVSFVGDLLTFMCLRFLSGASVGGLLAVTFTMSK